MDTIRTSSPMALANLLRGLVPAAELQQLIAFVVEHAGADVIGEDELDELVERFVEADRA